MSRCRNGGGEKQVGLIYQTEILVYKVQALLHTEVPDDYLANESEIYRSVDKELLHQKTNVQVTQNHTVQNPGKKPSLQRPYTDPIETLYRLYTDFSGSFQYGYVYLSPCLRQAKMNTRKKNILPSDSSRRRRPHTS